jgi:hypothetical protein
MKFLGFDQLGDIAESSPNVLFGHFVLSHDLFHRHAASEPADNARDGNPSPTDHWFAMLYLWVYDNSLIHLSEPFLVVTVTLAKVVNSSGKGRFSVSEDAFGLKIVAKPSQGSPLA